MTFERQEKVWAFLRKQPFAFRHLVDAKQYCEQFTAGYPKSLFVDRHGIISNVLDAIAANYAPATKRLLSADDKEFYAALQQMRVGIHA